MYRAMVAAVFCAWSALCGASVTSAAESTIVAVNFVWQPEATPAAVGDVVTWIIGNGTHGVQIEEWDAVRPHVAVELVPDQQFFNEETGANDDSVNDAGKVLLRLKIVSSPPGGKISFHCIEHGTDMSGTINVGAAMSGPILLMSKLDMTQAIVIPSCAGEALIVAPSLANKNRLIGVSVQVFDGLDSLQALDEPAADITTVRSRTGPLRWEAKEEEVQVGEEIQWANGAGFHGLRITNWDQVRESIEIVEAHGGVGHFKTTGESERSGEVNKVYARLKIIAVPTATDTITYECVVHGSVMSGTVKIVPQAAPVEPHASTLPAEDLGEHGEAVSQLPERAAIEASTMTTFAGQVDVEFQGFESSEAPLIDGQGRTHSLREYEGSPRVVLMIKAPTCVHCLSQLSEFAEQIDSLKRPLIVLVPTTDLAEMPPLPFVVLADPQQVYFRKLGAYRDGPLHGTFVLNADNIVTFQKVGDVPFMDVMTIRQSLNGAAEPLAAVTQ